MKKILLLFFVLFSSLSYGQSFSDFIKVAGDRSILQCNVDSVSSTLVYLRRKDSPFYGIGVPFKEIRGLFVSDTSLRKKIATTSNFKILVSHPSQLSVSTSGKIVDSPVSLSDSVSRMAVSYHLERAGVNLNAGEVLSIVAGIVGGCTIFAKDLDQVKTISGIAMGVGIVAVGVRISGGKHLILAGQKIKYRK